MVHKIVRHSTRTGLTGFTATQVEAIDFWATEIILKKIFERTLQGLWEKVWDIVWQASTHAEK